MHVPKYLGALVPHSPHLAFPASPDVFRIAHFNASEFQFTMTSRRYALNFLSYVNASPTRESPVIQLSSSGLTQ